MSDTAPMSARARAERVAFLLGGQPQELVSRVTDQIECEILADRAAELSRLAAPQDVEAMAFSFYELIQWGGSYPDDAEHHERKPQADRFRLENWTALPEEYSKDWHYEGDSGVIYGKEYYRVLARHVVSLIAAAREQAAIEARNAIAKLVWSDDEDIDEFGYENLARAIRALTPAVLLSK